MVEVASKPHPKFNEYDGAEVRVATEPVRERRREERQAKTGEERGGRGRE
jgi:hypothetical protein